jgi:hypothetical protein
MVKHAKDQTSGGSTITFDRFAFHFGFVIFGLLLELLIGLIASDNGRLSAASAATNRKSQHKRTKKSK